MLYLVRSEFVFDYVLIYVIVKRWRSEISTFYLRGGEIMIIL